MTDISLLLTIGGGLSVALVLAFGIVYLNNLGLTRHCTGCGRRTSTKALSEIGCPECGKVAADCATEGTGDIAPVLKRSLVCCNCGGEIGVLHFWDNRDYCQTCLSASGFSVDDIQAMNTPLREVTKPDPASAFFGYLSLYTLVAAAIPICFFVVALIVSQRLDAARGVALVFTIVLAPVALTFVVGKCIALQVYPSTVWVRNGRIGVEEQGSCRFYDLSRCNWSFGNAAAGISDPLPYKSKRACILIHSSEQPATDAANMSHIAVGFDPAKRALWEKFLNLASVPNSD